MKTRPIRNHLVFSIFPLILAALACNLPINNAPNEGAEIEIQKKLAETSNLLLRSIDVSAQEVTIALDSPAGQSEAVVFSSILIIFETAMNGAPEAEQVRINLFTLGEPYASLTAQSKDFVEFSGNKIDIATFFGRIEMIDHRPPIAGLRQSLASNGWVVLDAAITPERVYIEALQPAAVNKADITSGWYQAMVSALRYAPDSEKVVLHLILAQPPNLTVEASMEYVSLFSYGEMDAASFLASLIISDG